MGNSRFLGSHGLRFSVTGSCTTFLRPEPAGPASSPAMPAGVLGKSSGIWAVLSFPLNQVNPSAPLPSPLGVLLGRLE